MMDREVFRLGVCLGEHLGWIAEPVLSLKRQMVSYHQDLEHLQLNLETDNIVHFYFPLLHHFTKVTCNGVVIRRSWTIMEITLNAPTPLNE